MGLIAPFSRASKYALPYPRKTIEGVGTWKVKDHEPYRYLLRRLLAERLPLHRESARTKLKEMGVFSIKNLRTDQFIEFHKFLLTLQPAK